MRIYLLVACFVALFCLSDARHNDQPAPPPSCHVTGDPHVRTFGGEKMALQIPCMYRVTQVVSELVSTADHGNVRKMSISVSANNGLQPVKGRFFVSDVRVDIVHKKINPQNVDEYTGSVSTGQESIESAYNHQNSSLAWNVNSDPEVEDLIRTDFFPAENLAVLTVGNYVRLSFRPANPEGGVRQRPLPGLTVEILADGMVSPSLSEFPQTLCSRENPNATISEHAVTWNIPRNVVGILATLKQNEFQSLGTFYQREKCTAVNTAYMDCSDGDAAVKKCAFLLTRRRVVSCVERVSGVSALYFLGDCLRETCGGSNWACDKARNLPVDCPEIKKSVVKE